MNEGGEKGRKLQTDGSKSEDLQTREFGTFQKQKEA